MTLIGDKYIHVRDIDLAIYDLESERDGYQEEIDEAREAIDAAETDDERETAETDLRIAERQRDEWEEENAEYLAELRNVAAEVPDGETMILDSEFTQYAMDLAYDLHGSSHGWPFDYIDWNAAADALKMDYSVLEFGGETYYYRA